MKAVWKWLLPVLTILVVIGAAVLPQWLSQVRDTSLLGEPHVEEVADELFSPSSELTKRLELLARWNSGDRTLDKMPYSTEELSEDMTPREEEVDALYSFVPHSTNLEQRGMDALNTLAEAMPVLKEFLPEAMPEIRAQRVYLFLEEGVMATFINFVWMEVEAGWTVHLTLDEATERVVSLSVSSPKLLEFGVWGEEATATWGQQFFSYLGVSGESIEYQEGPRDSVCLEITDTNVIYLVSRSTGNTFSMIPEFLYVDGAVDFSDGGLGITDARSYSTEIEGKDGKKYQKIVEK